jgi:hypothetical protein
MVSKLAETVPLRRLLVGDHAVWLEPTDPNLERRIVAALCRRPAQVPIAMQRCGVSDPIKGDVCADKPSARSNLLEA